MVYHLGAITGHYCVTHRDISACFQQNTRKGLSYNHMPDTTELYLDFTSEFISLQWGIGAVQLRNFVLLFDSIGGICTVLRGNDERKRLT